MKKLFFAVFGTLIIMWQMLLSGYVLTLDMVFGPHMSRPLYSDLSAATFPFSYLIYLLHFVLGGWVIEKILLFILFFLLFYLPLHFYPFSNNHGEVYFVSILYAVNPFVYERFLAGQWKILVAYAILFPFVSFLIRFQRDLSWRSILYACVGLLGIGMFSLHILVMGAIILFIFVVAAIIQMLILKEHQNLYKFIFRMSMACLLLCAISSYWLIPAFTANTTIIGTFTQADWNTFYTAKDVHIGTLGNVAALYGFWGEHEKWVTNFISPKMHGLIWAIFGGILVVIILMGLVYGIRERHRRGILFWLVAIGFLSFLFSSGIGGSMFKFFNLWLFGHIWFWRGFRDTEKWSAVLVLVYALLGGLGVRFLAQICGKYGRFIIFVSCFVPLFYTPTMLFGFSGQLQPVWYPSVWGQINEILKKNKNCKAVFLPWHQYYTAEFNNRVLAANTASSYFDCNIISSKNAEIGNIGDQAGNTPEYYKIGSAVTSNTYDPDATVRLLKRVGVQYVIFTNDETYDDSYLYPFLHSKLLRKIINTPTVSLFSVDGIIRY